MADLGNSKIKDTYTLVLQTDVSGNLQKLDGTTPSPFIVNGNLRYVDGNQALNYVLTSDASGNASWAEAGGTSYWSANTDGSISPSGLTTSVGIGTITPNKPLTVVGDISGTTDLYLGSATHTASTITAEERLIIKGTTGNDYLLLTEDFIQIYYDGSEDIGLNNTGIALNSSARDRNVQINSEDGTVLFTTNASKNVVRLLDYVSINKPDTWTWQNEQKQALAVSGTSVIYSGGSSHTSEAIVAIGNISGTTDLYLGDSAHTGSTIAAQEQLTIKGREADNDYMVLSQDRLQFYLDGLEFATFTSLTHPSAAGGITFNSSSQDYDFTIKGDDTTPIFQVYGESGGNRIRIRDHLTIGKAGGISHADAVNWGLAVTGSSLFYSGGTSTPSNAITAVGDISGTTNLHIDGDTHTTNLILAANGYIMPATSSNTIKMRAQTYDGEMLSIGPDLLQVNMNSAANLQITPTQVTFNAVGVNQSFRIMTDTGNFTVESDADYDLLALTSQGGTSIGGTTKRWPTDSGYNGSAPNKTLQVNGITTIYSGGTGNSWSGDTTALSVAGNISGETDLHIGGIITTVGGLNNSGNTLYDGTISGTGSVTATAGFVGNVTGNADTVTNGVYTTNNLSVMASTTSAQLAGVISNATGTGLLTFGTSPTIKTPTIETPTIETPIIQYPKNYFAEPTSTPVASIAGADIVKEFGDNVATTAGDIYFFNTLGTWTLADASAVDTAQGLLAVALASESDDGMLLRGMVTVGTLTPSVGSPIYLSEVAGDGTATVPTTSGAVVRLIGYSINSARTQIWFNPDNAWVELT